MDPDGDKQIEVFQRKDNQNKFLQRFVTCSLFIFQSIWIRCRSILFDGSYGEYLESQLSYVLYCGSFFWFIYLLIKIT
jgi:hypothetical protein